MRGARLIALLCFCGLALAATPGAATAAPGELDEPFFPRAGNRGYDALHYEVDLHYDQGSGRIRATERIRAEATQGLRTFSLDLYGLRVRSVRVAGQPARSFERSAGKLRVTAAEPLESGTRFTVVLRYDGLPRPLVGADGTPQGWLRTDDGALTMSEPLGTATWLACNNVPWDKASFEVRIGVPRPLVAVSNGRLERFETDGRLRRYQWQEAQPMSPYLAVVDIGRGKLLRHEIGGRPSWTFLDPRLASRARAALRALPEIIRFQSRLLGGYPFDTAGSIVDSVPGLGFALETQSRPTYSFIPSRTLIVHETAHQWFGDSVGLERWPDIWLNEGFATWMQWYYAERHGGRSAASVFRELRQVPATDERFWQPPPGNPGSPKRLFDPTVYIRGAMALQALREEIGTKSMLEVLRRWTVEHRYGSAGIGEFVALAEEVAERDLDPLFGRWLFQRGKPR